MKRGDRNCVTRIEFMGEVFRNYYEFLKQPNISIEEIVAIGRKYGNAYFDVIHGMRSAIGKNATYSKLNECMRPTNLNLVIEEVISALYFRQGLLNLSAYVMIAALTCDDFTKSYNDILNASEIDAEDELISQLDMNKYLMVLHSNAEPSDGRSELDFAKAKERLAEVKPDPTDKISARTIMKDLPDGIKMDAKDNATMKNLAMISKNMKVLTEAYRGMSIVLAEIYNYGWGKEEEADNAVANRVKLHEADFNKIEWSAMPEEEMHKVGFIKANKSDTGYLVPLIMYPYFKDGTKFTSILGMNKVKGMDYIDNDIRYGCMSIIVDTQK